MSIYGHVSEEEWVAVTVKLCLLNGVKRFASPFGGKAPLSLFGGLCVWLHPLKAPQGHFWIHTTYWDQQESLSPSNSHCVGASGALCLLRSTQKDRELRAEGQRLEMLTTSQLTSCEGCYIHSNAVPQHLSYAWPYHIVYSLAKTQNRFDC